MSDKVWKSSEWLLKKGHIKAITRGRRSDDIHKVLSQAVADGVKFSDYTPKVSKKRNGETRIINTSPAAAPGEKTIADISFFYPEAEWEAFEVESGKSRSVREACQQHRASLTTHPCPGAIITSVDGDPSGVIVSMRMRKGEK